MRDYISTRFKLSQITPTWPALCPAGEAGLDMLIGLIEKAIGYCTIIGSSWAIPWAGPASNQPELVEGRFLAMHDYPILNWFVHKVRLMGSAWSVPDQNVLFFKARGLLPGSPVTRCASSWLPMAAHCCSWSGTSLAHNRQDNLSQASGIAFHV